MPSRTGHRKSRHGCSRCKQRRVKVSQVPPGGFFGVIVSSCYFFETETKIRNHEKLTKSTTYSATRRVLVFIACAEESTAV